MLGINKFHDSILLQDFTLEFTVRQTGVFNIHTHSPILLSASLAAASDLLTPSLDRTTHSVSMDYRERVAAGL